MSNEGLQRLTMEIADALGSDWSYTHTGLDRIGTITTASGAEIYVSLADDRVLIRGGWPKSVDGTHFYPSYREKSPEITCAVSRGAEAIARDIVRRFLPHYLPLYQSKVEYRDGVLAFRARRQRDLEAIADVIGGSVRPHGDGVQCGGYPGKQVVVKVDYYDPEAMSNTLSQPNVNLELSRVPWNLALEIARLFRDEVGR